MSMNKALIALAMGLALAACQKPAEEAAPADAAAAPAADAAAAPAADAAAARLPTPPLPRLPTPLLRLPTPPLLRPKATRSRKATKPPRFTQHPAAGFARRLFLCPAIVPGNPASLDGRPTQASRTPLHKAVVSGVRSTDRLLQRGGPGTTHSTEDTR